MMNSELYERQSIIDDRYGGDSMEYADNRNDFYNTMRPRLHTWPTVNFFDHSFSTPFSEGIQQTIIDDQADPRLQADKLKSKNKSPNRIAAAKSPTQLQQQLQQTRSQQQQPRRKLTTHKLSAKSYVDLITEAIVSASERRMTLADIYKWMVANVPCFKQQANVSASSGWKNAVRHTLSLHKRFKRVQRGRLQKPAWWTIQDQDCGNTVPIGTVAGRAPATDFAYQRRNSEGCFDNVKQENFDADTYSAQDVGGDGGDTNAVYRSQGSEVAGWASPTAPTPAAAMGVYNYGTWDDGSIQPEARYLSGNALSGAEEDEDGADSGFESHAASGEGSGYLTRTTSDASSYGSSSPYRVKTLSKAYSPIEFQAEEYKLFSKSYEPLQPFSLQEESEKFGLLQQLSPVNERQSVLVQTEKGTVAHICVPMPLRVDVRQQSNRQAQTMGYLGNYTLSKQPINQLITRISDTETGLPHDLLSVQVDSQVQCNVAEVLAYEMKASSTTAASESSGVGDLYDLLKAGCALD